MQPVPQQPDVHVDNVETANVTNTTDHAVNDTITVRIVVLMLGIIVIGILIAETVLVLNGKTFPESLLVLAGVAVGALSSLLASTASKRT